MYPDPHDLESPQSSEYRLCHPVLISELQTINLLAVANKP